MGAFLIFLKYFDHIDVDIVTEYLEKLSHLHPDYQGLSLHDEGAHLQSPREIAHAVVFQVEGPRGTSNDVTVHCGQFGWNLDFSYFAACASAFNTLYDRRSIAHFTVAYGEEATFADDYAKPWGAQGICDEFLCPPGQLLNAWVAYLTRKNEKQRSVASQAPSRIIPVTFPKTPAPTPHCFLDAPYREPQRTSVSQSLRILRECVESRYGHDLTFSNWEPRDRLFMHEVDAYLLDTFGPDRLSELVSVFDMPLAQWLSNPQE